MPQLGEFVVGRDLLPVLPDLQPQIAEQTHVDVGDEHQ